MMFNVPQFINIEDKIIGPLGWKQILWLIGLGGILFVLYSFVESRVLIVISIPISALFIALAFFKPYGQPFIKVILFVVTYFFKPKVYIWKRETSKPVKKAPKKTVQETVVPQKKEVTEERISDLAKILNERSRF